MELSIDNVDINFVYWNRNEKNYKLLIEDMKKLDTTECEKELNQFIQHLKNLQEIEQRLIYLMKIQEIIQQKQKQLTEKLKILEVVEAELQNIYISMKSQITTQTIINDSDDQTMMLICTQCDQKCHKTCRSQQNDIEYCNRFKKGFCKSCYKNNDQICRPNQHLLDPQLKNYEAQTTVILLNSNLFKTINEYKQKDLIHREVRLMQMDIFQIQKGYFQEVKKLKQLLILNQDQINNPLKYPQKLVNGYLSINFETQIQFLGQMNLDKKGQIYQRVINDIVGQ